MNIYKQGKLIAVSAVMLIGLAACNNNNDEALDLRDNRMTTLNNGNGTGYWDHDTKRLRQQSRRSDTNERQMQNGGNGTSEILQMPNGYLTVDPNSYSTGTPSSKYPHTQMNRQGRLTYEDWQQRARQPEGRDQRLLQPPAGTQPGAVDQDAAPVPDQGPLQAPMDGTAPTERGTAPTDQGTAPAEQRTAPTPEQDTAPEQNTNLTQSGTELSAFESRVIDLTNEQRRKNGLSNLQPDTALSNVAQEKSNDMQAKNYFSHTSPTYGSPFDMMRDFGVTYSSAGENIAMGQQSAEEVVNAWMNSEGHRKNILSPNFTHIGVGHTGSGNYWTQMFIGK